MVPREHASETEPNHPSRPPSVSVRRLLAGRLCRKRRHASAVVQADTLEAPPAQRRRCRYYAHVPAQPTQPFQMPAEHTLHTPTVRALATVYHTSRSGFFREGV